MIQSFAPGEITPEKALKIGIELCQKFLKEEYQYYLAVHTDKEHIHLHCIFNRLFCKCWGKRKQRSYEINQMRTAL